MSTVAITDHYAHLQQHGTDLGAPQGDEQAAGYGGRFQVYESGRIYWHPTTGAHGLRGRLLQRYLDAGGHDVNPQTSERELGFPTSDHVRTEDGRYEVAKFEWGIIADVAGTPLVRLFGTLYEAWRQDGGALGRLGHPLTDVTRTEGGRAAWFEGGLLWHAEGSADVLIGELVLPTLGQPLLANPAAPGPFDWMRFDGAVGVLDGNPALPARLLAGRLSLIPVGGGFDPGMRPTIRDAGGAAGSGSSGGEGPPHPTTTSPDVASMPKPPLAPIADLHPDEALVEVDGERRLRFKLPQAATGGGGRFSRLLEARRSSDVRQPAPSGLQRRQLYSIAFRTPGLHPRIVAPHCVYARADWSDFGIAHVTDLHVNRRAESYRSVLRATNTPQSDISQFNNWNDAFRQFIRYANHLHAAGLLDVIMATGDLVDYVREADDHPDGPGSFGLFEAIVQGHAPSPDPEGTPSEALRVPIFTTLGNHDYRTNPYPLAFSVQVREEDFLDEIPLIGHLLEVTIEGTRDVIKRAPGIGLPLSQLSPVGLITQHVVGEITQYQGLNVTRSEALKLMGLRTDPSSAIFGAPVLTPEGGARSLIVDQAMKDRSHYYFRRINRDPSYTVELGPHRLVMIDTRWDAGLFEGIAEAIIAKAGYGPESRRHLVGNNPDSEGATPRDLELIDRALRGAAENGLVIVGMHAPPINPKGNELPNYFRETAHPTADPIQVSGYLLRSDVDINRDNADETSPGWPRTGTPYFHRGEMGDLLDFGTAVNLKEELAQVFAGAGRPRGVTMVLCGHVHMRIDYRLLWNKAAAAIDAYTDHYFENPKRYYPMRLAPEAWWVDAEDHRRVLVRVDPAAPPEGRLEEMRDNRDGPPWGQRYTLSVAPYAAPLASASDPKAWWKERGAIVVQTAALGPCTNVREDLETNSSPPGPQFQGFRLLQISGDVIQRVRYITMPELRTSSFPLAWERRIDRAPVPGVTSQPTEPSEPATSSGVPPVGPPMG